MTHCAVFYCLYFEAINSLPFDEAGPSRPTAIFEYFIVRNWGKKHNLKNSCTPPYPGNCIYREHQNDNILENNQKIRGEAIPCI